MRVLHVPSTDGVVLEVQDRAVSSSAPGGAGVEREAPVVFLLAHANGFHGRVFDPLVDALVRHDRPARVVTFDMRAHGGSTAPLASTARSRLEALRWDRFADDVLAVVDALGVRGRCVGVGHSLGGHAMLRAEARRPGTFASIVAHEPIFVVPDDALPRGTAKTPLAEAAARRRRRFASREAALAAFASKPPLDALHPDALRAYCEHGFTSASANEKGGERESESESRWRTGEARARAGREVQLAMAPEDESAVFSAGAEEAGALPAIANRRLKCPVTIICGSTAVPGAPGAAAYAAVIAPVIVEALRAGGAEARLESKPAMNHFGPIQDPESFAEAAWRHADWARARGGGRGGGGTAGDVGGETNGGRVWIRSRL